MKKTLTFNDFVDEFMGYGRFEQMGGIDGLQILFDYLEELESETGKEIELDVISLCCDFGIYTEDEYISEFYKWKRKTTK